VFVYGHSLGGLIATTYALEHEAELAGLVLSGPALVLPQSVTGGEISAAKFFGTVLPNLPAQPVDEDGFVSTAEERKAFDADPLIDHENVSARLARTTLLGIEALAPRMEQLKLPLLVMHATTDALTSPEGSREFHRRAMSTDKELVMWDGVFHDLLHEPRREEVLAKVTGWLEARL
jgi:acylglycerol lipase